MVQYAHRVFYFGLDSASPWVRDHEAHDNVEDGIGHTLRRGMRPRKPKSPMYIHGAPNRKQSAMYLS